MSRPKSLSHLLSLFLCGAFIGIHAQQGDTICYMKTVIQDLTTFDSTRCLEMKTADTVYVDNSSLLFGKERATSGTIPIFLVFMVWIGPILSMSKWTLLSLPRMNR